MNKADTRRLTRDQAEFQALVDEESRGASAAERIVITEELRRGDALLREGLGRSECTSAELLLHLEAGLLSQADASALEIHLAYCRPCQSERAALRATLSEELEPIPAVSAHAPQGQLVGGILERAWEWLEGLGKRLTEAMPVLEPVLVPVKGEALAQGVASVIGVEEGERTWHYFFKAPDYDLDLDLSLERREGRWRVVGNLIADEHIPERVTVRLLEAGPIAESEVDGLGGFAFSGVSAGRYLLYLELPEIGLVVELPRLA